MNGKVVGSVAVLLVLLFSYLGLNLFNYSAVSNTVSAENYLAGITSAYPDDLALIGWGNIESRHNVFSNYPVQRCLVKPPPTLFSSIPPGSTINSAKLRVYTKDYNTPYCSDSSRRTYGAHKISIDWNPSSVTWRNQPSFNLLPTATISKAPMTDVNQWWEWDITNDINSPYGWALKDETEDAGGLTGWRYIIFIDTAEILIDYTLPSYVITVHTKFTDNTPVSGAQVYINDGYVGTTSSGIFTTSPLQYGSYTVKVVYSGNTQTQTVSLTGNKDVTFTFPTPPPPIKYYDLTVTVKDQFGHPLPASLLANDVPYTCDSGGRTTVPQVQEGTKVNLKASIQVGAQTFEKTDSVTMTTTTSRTITITRRFYWKFYLNYSDGSLPTGTLSATSTKETLTSQIVNGFGQGYLWDGQYSFSFTASPAVSLGSQSIVNDGILYATIPKPTTPTTPTTPITANVTTSTTTEPVIFTPTTPPALYLTSTHIYLLTGVLTLLGVVALYFGLRRAKR
jgi:hypothetical protein